MIRPMIAALAAATLIVAGCDQSTNTYNCSDDTPCDDQGNALDYAPYVNPYGITILPGYPGYIPVYVGHPFGWGPRRSYHPGNTYVQNHYHQNINSNNRIQNNNQRQQNNGVSPPSSSRPAPKATSKPKPSTSSKH